MECGPVPFELASLLLAIVACDAAGVKRALRAGGPGGALARARLKREDVQKLLGPGAHLGSQWCACDGVPSRALRAWASLGALSSADNA